jgi:rhodanese-related sulfurtransferase
LEDLSSLDLDRNTPVVVYCGDDICPKGTIAVERLRAAGYEDVASLRGGLNEWLRHEFPTESGAVSQAPPASVSAKAVVAAVKANSLVVDVRPREEFNAGHIPGSLNIPLEVLDAKSVLPSHGDIIVVDRSFVRSRAAAMKLTAAGFSARELSGGIAAWLKRGFPLKVK